MDRTKTLACLIALIGAACSKPHLSVGSKNFTEQVLLGEVLAQQIERRIGIQVYRELNLGGTMLAHEALVKGDIDLYPEYTGTALTAVLKQPPLTDAAAAFEAVRKAYAQQWHLAWLQPLGFNNTFAMIVRGKAARARHLETLSDAARAQAWRMGMGYEFRQRPDGLGGLVRAYGLRNSGDPITMDLGLLYQALESEKVDMVAANSTDGQISKLDVKVLDDDRRYFPPYQCAVVVREDAFTRFPSLRGALDELSGKLTDESMRKLNYAVDAEHRPVKEVAAGFLKGIRR